MENKESKIEMIRIGGRPFLLLFSSWASLRAREKNSLQSVLLFACYHGSKAQRITFNRDC
jgi:hypothetical protein